MRTKVLSFFVVGLVAALALGGLAARDYSQGGLKKVATGQEKGREADQEAVRKSSHDLVKAFEKGDARAIAALWTEQGEMHDASGEVIRGRAAIEKEFTEFFKENPKARIEVLIEAIRFPAPDLAIEEGILRQEGSPKDLPATTLYSAIHVRIKGQWLLAVSHEWGAGQDRLEDLDWLLGKWRGTLGDQEVVLAFTRDEKKPFVIGQFTRQVKGKVVAAGTMRIGNDPQTGQLRSWHFDEDGGHGQALWLRDGNRWVLDAIGVQGDGAETAAVNIISRISKDEFTWRSIDRVRGDQALPDTAPIKLSRVAR